MEDRTERADHFKKQYEELKKQMDGGVGAVKVGANEKVQFESRIKDLEDQLAEALQVNYEYSEQAEKLSRSLQME